MVQGHTGRGINHECDCEFCMAKKQHTWIIGNANYLVRNAKRHNPFTSLRMYDYDPRYMEDWIWVLRKEARKQAREELKQLKEK